MTGTETTTQLMPSYLDGWPGPQLIVKWLKKGPQRGPFFVVLIGLPQKSIFTPSVTVRPGA